MEPHETVYCGVCGWPVVYCTMRSQNKQRQLGCSAWLAKAHPDLSEQLYGSAPREALEQETARLREGGVGEETVEEETGEVELAPGKATAVPPFGVPIKPHVKRQAGYVPYLQIRLVRRGGNNYITQVWNYGDFPQLDVRAACGALARRFAASCGMTTTPDGAEELMALQGNFVDGCVQYFREAGVPAAQIHVAPETNFRGKKRPVVRGCGHQQRIGK